MQTFSAQCFLYFMTQKVRMREGPLNGPQGLYAKHFSTGEFCYLWNWYLGIPLSSVMIKGWGGVFK